MLELVRRGRISLVSFPPYSCIKAQFLFSTLCAVSHLKMPAACNTQYDGTNKNSDKPVLDVGSHGSLKSFLVLLPAPRATQKQ